MSMCDIEHRLFSKIIRNDLCIFHGIYEVDYIISFNFV